MAFVVVFWIGQYVVQSTSIPVYWWADIAWTLASFLAGLECLRTAQGLDKERRRAWLCFGAGCLVWFAGMLVWDYRELVQQRITPFPDYSDIGFVALPPLFLAGLVYMSSRRGGGLGLKDTADLGVIVTVVIFGAWLMLAVHLRDPELPPMYRGTAAAIAVMSSSTFMFALLALLRHAPNRGRAILWLFLGSLGLHAVTNTFYAYSLLEESYQAGDVLDVFWIIAFAMTYCAAVMQQSQPAGAGPNVETLQSFNVRMRRADTLVFSGMLVLLGIIALWQREALVFSPGILGLFLLALTIFLGLREWANQRIQLALVGEIRASELELGRILNNLDDTYYRLDLRGTVLRVSGSAWKLTGYTPDEMIGRPVSDFHEGAEERKRVLDAMDSSGGSISNHQSRLVHKDGRRIWISTNAHYIHDDAGRVIGIEGTARDVSELKAAEEEMRKLSGALKQSADAVMITDRDGVIEYVNPAFEATTGFTFDETVGRTPRILKSGEHERSYYDGLWSTIRAGDVFRDVMVNKCKDGSLYYEDKTITPLMDEAGNTTHLVSTGKDISEQVKVQERLRHIAHHDALTNLPNRTLFLDRVEQVVARTSWRDRLAAVLFMDLDQFKNINDSLGHEVGDKLLVSVAERLQAELRPGDTVARFGGDEFVVLLDDVNSYDDITLVVEKLRRALQNPFVVDGLSLYVTATMGISIHPHDGLDGKTLLKNADNAMYRAKEHGRNTYTFYSVEMSTRVHDRLNMETRLRNALDNREFELLYQPQIDIVDNRVVGVEALLRWHPADGETAGPSVFVPLLEDTGLIIPVGEWILRTACAQTKQWNRDAGLNLALAVNISARQFNDSRFVDLVKDLPAATGLDTGLLQLEMTESVYLRPSDTANATMDALDEVGVRLAIDDFGTGYSALSYLKRLPIRVLKIDRSFIRDIPDAEDDAALTIAVLAMARGLGVRVVAEGVETRAQLEFLRRHGCRYAQGYLFSEPLSAAPLEALLRDPSFPSSRVEPPAQEG